MQITLRNQLIPKHTFTLYSQFIYLTRRVTDTKASFRLVTFRARHEDNWSTDYLRNGGKDWLTR
jgi:hypothetical protein